MRILNFEIRISSNYKTRKVKGFVASIKTQGNFKFGVCEVAGRWRTTELSTGVAVPGSFADNAEDSVKNAQASIDRQKSKTYFQGVVDATNALLKRIKEQ